MAYTMREKERERERGVEREMELGRKRVTWEKRRVTRQGSVGCGTTSLPMVLPGRMVETW